MSRFKKILFALVALSLACGISALFLELVFRFLPVHGGLNANEVSMGQPIFRFEPNRTFTWSLGWNLELAHRVRVNNAGFVNDQDYVRHDAKPLVAIVGDSYVEALQVPYAQTGAARLASDFKESHRVYTFGASGAPLSQYLAYARYATETYQAQKLIFIIVGNDFDESLMKYKSDPGFHYFVEDQTHALRLQRVDYRVSLWKKLLRTSALARYLLVNLKIQALPKQLSYLFRQRQGDSFVGNTSSETAPERMRDSRRAVDAFFEHLKHDVRVPLQQMLFVVDGMRPELYDERALAEAERSYFGLMRRYFLDRAQSQGANVIDMQPIFRQQFSSNGTRFEHPRDAHWNELGHDLFAQAVAKSGFLRKITP